MSDLQRLNSIASRNGDIAVAPLTNMEESMIRKGGWGYIKIAVSNEWVQRLLSHPENIIGGLYLTTKEEWERSATHD
jgi:hypothetical protein